MAEDKEMKKDNEIIQTETMKGQWCPFAKTVICQEGWCTGCWLHKTYEEKEKEPIKRRRRNNGS